MNKDLLYISIQDKLDKAKEDKYLYDPFSKGFTLGVIMGLIGAYYRSHVIDFPEYDELTNIVKNEIDRLCDEKMGGAKHDTAISE